jgi:hypothetical protein
VVLTVLIKLRPIAPNCLTLALLFRDEREVIIELFDDLGVEF